MKSHFGKGDGGGSNYYIDTYVLDELGKWLTEALSHNGEEVPYDDIRAIANREVQEVMNQGAKLSSEEQFALNELFIELGEVFYSKLQHSTPSPNPLLEEVKKRLLKLPPIGWDSPTADVLRQEYTDLIKFSEGGK